MSRDELLVLNAYELAKMAGIYAPDTLDSAGANFLTRVRDDYIEAIEYHDGEPFDACDACHEVADSAVPIYTHQRWQAFIDLGAYNEDVTDLGTDASDLTACAGVALYIIAERLCAVLATEVTE